MRSRTAAAFFFLSISSCGGSPPPAATTPSGEGSAALTAEACEKEGGHVVGDIGNGAIHRPGYRCEGSGEPPIGPIKAEPGKPMAIEGAVCCR